MRYDYCQLSGRRSISPLQTEKKNEKEKEKEEKADPSAISRRIPSLLFSLSPSSFDLAKMKEINWPNADITDNCTLQFRIQNLWLYLSSYRLFALLQWGSNPPVIPSCSSSSGKHLIPGFT